MKSQPYSFAPTTPTLPRRSFLRYGGAGMLVGSLWLAGCRKEEDAAPAKPTVASFSPGSGAPGAAVTVTGTNLTGATSVTVGGVAASFTIVNDTTLTLMVPAGSQTGAIAVTTAAGTSVSSRSFTVLPASLGVTITGLTPASAAPGTVVTLTGTGFAGTTAVALGGTAVVGFTVVNATTLTFTVPAGAQTGPVTVTAPGGTATSSMPLTVLPATINVGTTGPNDLGVLNYAYALEQLEAAFYERVRSGSYYQGLAGGSAERQVLTDLLHHETAHREFLKAALDAQAIPVLTPDFASIDFGSRSSVLSAAKAFEDLGVAAYNGAARFIQRPSNLLLVGKIVSVEARHAALVRDLLQESTFVDADVVNIAVNGLEKSKAPSAVVTVVNTFLAPGSKLDVSGLV